MKFYYKINQTVKKSNPFLGYVPFAITFNFVNFISLYYQVSNDHSFDYGIYTITVTMFRVSKKKHYQLSHSV